MYNEKLKSFFISKGLSQKKVGEMLGYSPTMMSRYYRGTDKINADFIIKMVQTFPDIDLKYIFSEEETINSVQEPKPFYGLNKENIDKELELIGQKVDNVRKYLAQISHKN
jgi:transcriptional regulator with XRE-family HTH domain